MAKNLKLNIKNAQLAEALKLGQIKKKPAKKKPTEESSEAVTETSAAPAAAETPAVNKAPPKRNSSEEMTTPPTEEKAKPTEAKSVESGTPPPAPVKEDRAADAKVEKPIDTSGWQSRPPQQDRYPRRESDHPPRQEGTGYTPRQDSGGYPPRREGGYPPRQEGGGYPPRREGGYPPRQEGGGYPPRREGGYPPRQDGGGYPPRREGGYPPRQDGGGYPPRREGGYPPRQDGGGYPPRREGGYPPRQDGGGYPPRREGGYPPRQDGGGYPPRREGGYPPRQDGGGYPPRREGGYPPRQDGGGYPPRREGGYPPRQDGGGYPPRREGGYPPRQDGGGYPPRREGGGFPPRSGFPPRTGPGGPPRRPMAPTAEPARNEKGGRVMSHGDFDKKKIPQKDARDAKPTRRFDNKGFDARDRSGLRADTEEQGWRKRRPLKGKHIQQEEVIRPKALKVRIPITVKDLASEMKLKASQLIAKLFMKGVVITLNDYLDDETTIQLLGHDFDCEITIDTSEEERLRITDKTIKQEISENPQEDLVYRPPVVAFMGHVDHGKTSLIDAIRKSKLAAGEAGEITQHIGAFKCRTDAGDITILDTPGHEAFSAMRERGADVTDIVVLVVAGDEGIRPQTIEAITQAQAASVPILVAINKCDKPNFDAETVYRQLAERNLLPESWGGQIITVNCSAVTGVGIKELLEMLALQAEILELKANPLTRARGTVIESEMHKGMGAVATLLVQNGTLHLGDALVFAQNYARVKTMQDEHGMDLKNAGPSTPIKITGLSGLPEAGSEFFVVKNEKEAMDIAEKRQEGSRHTQLLQTKRLGMESFLTEQASGIQKKYLNLILRADVQGSVEALKSSLLKIATKKVELNFISSGVGEISESDVQLANASKATIIGFHTQIESRAASLIKELKVTVKMHDIIYHAVDDVRAIMLTLLDKIPQETDTGTAEVKIMFSASQLGMIAGCMITDGTIKRSNHIRQIRDNKVIWKGPIASLKRVKEDVREVSKGYECGILLQNNNEVKAGDILQAFEITYLEQEL